MTSRRPAKRKEWSYQPNGKPWGSSAPLTRTHPKLCKEWHPTRNSDLTPADVSAGSGRKVWWKCPKGSDHEYRDLISHRTSKLERRGCPFCSGRRASVTNSLARRFPKIAAQWHPSRNKPLTQALVQIGYSKRVWWKCAKGAEHVWQASVAQRTRSGSDCPFCSGRRVTHAQSLAALHLRLMKEWHPTKNRGVDPFTVAPRSSRLIWWRCKQGPDHVWRVNPAHRNRPDGGPGGCPFCAGHRVSVTNSLASRYPAVAAEWHAKWNGTLKPDQIVAGSCRKAWWQCGEASDHVWEARIESRTRLKSGCPYCCGNLVPPSRQLARTYPAIAREWHPTRNGKRTPHTTADDSYRGIWWRCRRRGHVWRATVFQRAKGGEGCPECEGM